MPAEFSFSLRLSGPVEDNLDALYEAGCDDAALTSTAGVWEAIFDREAETLADAVRSATSDVESVEGISVVSVDLEGGT